MLQDQMLGVARLQASELATRLSPKNIGLHMSDAALRHAVVAANAAAGGGVYGARPLRRWLEQHVITDLSRMLLTGELAENTDVVCDLDPAAAARATAAAAAHRAGPGSNGSGSEVDEPVLVPRAGGYSGAGTSTPGTPVRAVPAGSCFVYTVTPKPAPVSNPGSVGATLLGEQLSKRARGADMDTAESLDMDQD
jgi:hypothetical protein